MYKAVHCVTSSEWTACKTSFRQLPYVELVLESDYSSVVEYDVINRIVLKDVDYDEIRLHLIQGSLLRTEDFELYCGDLTFVTHSTCSDYDASSIGCVSIRNEKDETTIPPIDFFDIVNVAGSVNNFSCALKEFLLSTPAIEQENSVSITDASSIERCPLKEFLLSTTGIEQENSVSQCSEVPSVVIIDARSAFVSRRRDWRVIDYVLEHSHESSFVTALSLADQVTALRNWAENSKLRRIKLNTRRVCDTRDAFISKYNLPSSANILSFDAIQERLNPDRKLLILLDDDLNVLAGPVRSLKGRPISDLLILIRFPNDVWYPASRRVIKMVMRTFVVDHSVSKHVYKKC
jgi:hypothetical protein